MVDTVLSLGSAGKSTGPYRWNLKSQERFPQWELDTRRALRGIAPVGFLSSKRPTAPDVKPEPGVKQPSVTGGSAAETLLRKVQAEWDMINMKVYETLEERVELCEADVNTVRGRFGDMAAAPYRMYDGVAFWAWILTHRNIALESTQLAALESISPN